MKSPKSPSLRSLLRLLRKANLNVQHPALDARTLAELDSADETTRRRFLQSLGLIGLGALLPLEACKTTASSAATPLKPINSTAKVAIVGAGMAGLYAAWVLKKAGIQADIYEADVRVGGRMYTKEIFGNGLTTEFGGEFIDSNHADILALVKEFNLELLDTQLDIDSTGVKKDAFFFNKRHYSEEDVIAEFIKIAPTLARDKKKCGEDYDTPAALVFDKMPLEMYIRSLQCATWLQDLLIAAYLAEFGLDTGEQSALNMIDMIDANTDKGFKVFGESDERYKIKGGNEKLTRILGEKLNAQIQTSKRLSGIKSLSNKRTQLIFDGGLTVEADFVILTLPFTILRLVDIQLSGISPDKLQCIKTLGYGQNNKLMLGFKERIWRKGSIPYMGYLFHSEIHNGWDNTHMQAENRGVGGYTVFLGGTPAVKMAMEAKIMGAINTAAETTVQQYLGRLDPVFPNAKANYNGVQGAAIWTNNPFVLASYTCYKPGQWNTISGLEIEPVGQVHFAGEHCSEDFQGYMNGSAETGRRAAQAILKQLK